MKNETRAVTLNFVRSGLLSVAAMLYLSPAPFAWGQSDERAKLVEGAKKEGKLLWYTSTNVTES